MLFGMAYVVLIKLLLVPILEPISTNLLGFEWGSPSHYISIVTSAALLCALIDFVFFKAIKQFNFTHNAKTYAGMTALLGASWIAIIAFELAVSRATFDSLIGLIALILAPILIAGGITTIVGTLLQSTTKAKKPKK